MKSILIATAALLALTGSALAAPSLKGDISVNADIVTVGDMFNDPGNLSTTAIFRAPALGTTGVVPLATIQNAARLIGLADFDAGGYQSVRVVHPSTVLDAQKLGDLIAANLANSGNLSKGVTAHIDFDIPDLSLNAAVTDTPASLAALRYTPGTPKFTARFAIAGMDQPVDLTGTVTLMTDVPRLVANAPAGQILDPSDFEMTSVPLTQAQAGAYADLDQLVGKQLIRQSRAGIMLKASDVGAPTVVTRNNLVTVLLKAGSMILTVKGQALANASAGQPVDVLNSITKKILHGVAQPDGTVSIDAPVTVAGL